MTDFENRSKRILSKGERAIGTWISSGSPHALDMLRNFSFDWFVMDMEHSPISIETVAHMVHVLHGSPATPMVRVGQIDQALFKAVLDAGAYGLVVPLVNTAEEAERAVRFAKYPPAGVRGAAGSKATGYGLNMGRYIRTANGEVMVVAQIETPQAVENIEKIVAVEGIDVAFVGPSDLTMTMGLLDDRSNPRVAEAMLKVVKACEDAGKAPGVMATSLDEARLAVQRGFRFVSLASDLKFMADGARAFLGAAGRA